MQIAFVNWPYGSSAAPKVLEIVDVDVGLPHPSETFHWGQTIARMHFGPYCLVEGVSVSPFGASYKVLDLKEAHALIRVREVAEEVRCGCYRCMMKYKPTEKEVEREVADAIGPGDPGPGAPRL